MSGPRLAHPGRLRRIDREGGNEGGEHLGAGRSLNSSEQAAERQDVGLVEAPQDRMTLPGDGGFRADPGAVDSCPQLGREPEVGVHGLAGPLSVGRDRAAAAGGDMGAEQVGQGEIRPRLAPLVVEAGLPGGDQVPAALDESPHRGHWLSDIAARLGRIKTDSRGPSRSMWSAWTGRYGMRARTRALTMPRSGKLDQLLGIVAAVEVGVLLRPHDAHAWPWAGG